MTKPTTTTTRKLARFPEQESDLLSLVIEIESRSDFSEDDKKNLWFARSDYHFSRSTARVISKESERYGYSKNLDAVYVAVQNETIQERLNMWAMHGHSRRGLERWANTAHGQARKEDSFIYIKGIVNAQQEMRTRRREEAAAAKEGGHEEAKEEGVAIATAIALDHERLRQVGHVLSRKSRLFAQMMGAADEYAAQCEFGMAAAAAAVASHNHHNNNHNSSATVGRTSLTSSRNRIRKNLGLSGAPSGGVPQSVPQHAQHPSPRLSLPMAPPQQQQQQPPQRVNRVSLSDLSLQRISISDAAYQGAQATPPMVMIPPKRRSAQARPGRVPRVA